VKNLGYSWSIFSSLIIKQTWKIDRFQYAGSQSRIAQDLIFCASAASRSRIIKMNDRENALQIVHFGQPERVVSSLPAYTLAYLGVNHQGFAGGGHDSPVGERWMDIWGTLWRKELAGVMGFPRGYPLADVAALKYYAWPDPQDERICAEIYQNAQDFPGGDLFLAGSHRDTLWEKSYMLVGMENMMVYFFEEPGFVREVLHRIMDFQLGIARHYLHLGVELVFLSDDLGTQNGPLLSPWIVNEFFLPEYERLCQLYKQQHVLVEFHSCGHIQPFLEMFMHLGVDILNPVQATANDLDQVRAVTQGRMALHGGISSAAIMDGPPHRIQAEVRRRMLQLGSRGGYFCDADQSLPFPEAHRLALREAVENFGKYPLQVDSPGS
jgi:uroporphyrinogen decarboxylase